ncbi:hypothetical protein CGSMWGv00703C2mash_01064 [Gardnerella pickettii 00703C2mash]|nr:hypothetical protein CGSMWGv00703C2mash_01064 [Gardnerella pickettii 00703C2mash]
MRDYCLIVVTILRSYTSFIGKSQERSQEKSQLYQTKKSRHAVYVKNPDIFCDFIDQAFYFSMLKTLLLTIIFPNYKIKQDSTS